MLDFEYPGAVGYLLVKGWLGDVELAGDQPVVPRGRGLNGTGMMKVTIEYAASSEVRMRKVLAGLTSGGLELDPGVQEAVIDGETLTFVLARKETTLRARLGLPARAVGASPSKDGATREPRARDRRDRCRRRGAGWAACAPGDTAEAAKGG